ncbi:ATP-binding protein [Salmonella enterica subsp. enterica serovar Senftenberg]|nr:ATP-binding protein [Salmonella enterica subsp. enterica serovar Senftenberg]
MDYFRKDNIFVIRDDGIGMSRADFENRWLTLGTESKVQNINTSLPPIDITKNTEIKWGEGHRPSCYRINWEAGFNNNKN